MDGAAAAAAMAGGPARGRDLVEAGRLLFARECVFVAGAPEVSALPPLGLPEIAFAGRSNVGKSSLVNALTGRKTLARVSHTPGRTQQLNFFDLGGHLGLVDMPGYGYAAVSKTKIAAWTELVEQYLRGRSTLQRIFLLVDGRHGLEGGRPRADDGLRPRCRLLPGRADQGRRAQTRGAPVSASPKPRRRWRSTRPPFPQVILTSSQTGAGIVELRESVARLLAERGALPLKI